MPTDMTGPSVLTRADHDPGAEWPEEVREIHIARAAPVRHDSRVARAKWAALQETELTTPKARAYAKSSGDCSPEIAAAQLCRWAAHGIGGPLGLGGPMGATKRPAWASGLGKGRRQATDGYVWDRALLGAALELELDAKTIAGEAWLEWSDHARQFREAINQVADRELLPWIRAYGLYWAAEETQAAEAHRWVDAVRHAETLAEHVPEASSADV